MLPELHAFTVSFYAKSVGEVTFSHVTKKVITPFDPQWPKTPCSDANFMALSCIQPMNQSYCRLKLYIAGIGNFAHFLQKKQWNLILCPNPKNDVDVTRKHVF